ncbi:MAG TPA: ABC transporter permease, partial [Xanthomonadales bacterium]|nr:ABC transporter permease [Xanthomonadales bacterium]
MATPGYTAIALLSLALAIGANTAVFSVVRGVLLEPLPYPNARELAYVWLDNRRQSIPDDITSWPNFMDWKAQNTTFRDMAGFYTTTVQLTGRGEPLEVDATYASDGFFDVLGIPPAAGRAFAREEFERGKDTTVVLGHALWQRLGGRPDIVGSTLDVSGRALTVVGVMPPAFAFPDEAELYLPLAPEPSLREARSAFWLPVIGRMKPGVDIAAAHADLQVIGERIEKQFPESEGYGVRAVSMLKYQVRDVASGLWLILAVVAGVLLIACANLANLMLVRAMAQRRALAVRAAIGASRWALVRHQLAECVVLAVVGAALGIALAWAALAALQGLVAQMLPRAGNIALDLPVLGFTIAVTIATAFAFGVLPALWSSRVKGSDALREGGRGQVGGRLASLSRRVLVVAQVGIAMTLLVGAGLGLRSFWNLLEVDPGLDLERAAVSHVSLASTRYDEQPARIAFMAALMERLAAVQGIQRASLSSSVRMGHIHNSGIFTIEGRPPVDNANRDELPLDSVWPGYFDVLGVPVVAGRAIDARDTADAPRVAMVNEAFANKYFASAQDALGHRFAFTGSPPEDPNEWLTIVGVVHDTFRRGRDEAVRIESWLPYAQRAQRSNDIVIRSSLPNDVLSRILREQVAQVDPLLPVAPVERVGALFEADAAPRRLSLGLLSCFALVAVVLAVVGVYGVIAYGVSQRTGEFGVRLALGAGPGRLHAMVLRQGMSLVGAGVLLGVVGALVCAQLAGALLFGVGGADPASYVAAAALFAL